MEAKHLILAISSSNIIELEDGFLREKYKEQNRLIFKFFNIIVELFSFISEEVKNFIHTCEDKQKLIFFA